MKELTLTTLIAVFEEIFGRGLFWLLVILAAVVSVAYLYVLLRDRAVNWKKFLFAQLSMPFGAIFAVAFVMFMTHSSLGDIGGPVDLIILLMIAGAGAFGAAILVYTVQSLFWPPSQANKLVT